MCHSRAHDSRSNHTERSHGFGLTRPRMNLRAHTGMRSRVAEMTVYTLIPRTLQGFCLSRSISSFARGTKRVIFYHRNWVLPHNENRRTKSGRNIAWDRPMSNLFQRPTTSRNQICDGTFSSQSLAEWWVKEVDMTPLSENVMKKLIQGVWWCVMHQCRSFSNSLQ